MRTLQHMVMAPRFDRGLTVVRFNYSIYMMVSIEVRVSVSCLTFWVLRPLTQSCFEDILYKVVHYFHDVKMILDLIFFLSVSIEVRVRVSCLTLWVIWPLAQSCFEYMKVEAFCLF